MIEMKLNQDDLKQNQFRAEKEYHEYEEQQKMVLNEIRLVGFCCCLWPVSYSINTVTKSTSYLTYKKK